LRLKAGLSQEDLAKNVGLRQPNISAIEAGKRMPEYETARKLANSLRVNVDDIYTAVENACKVKNGE
jgi:DNA-binding XRE family transcriptional regulator